ncbi:helix-turn-helix domain-containing protein [Flavivirga algicola]|uniref:Helix-turn-helix transcriptional regulator n=1 Tax=Flavivirga algicola TaxID=2729136 RepID=A0ABX1S3T2_9FLAO|nr:helix-turn-helix transcriptional regulator [Flavivirga algicola]NMH89873.1 helix-turn-helix transcriptional regulator [Flavivirga algicola]
MIIEIIISEFDFWIKENIRIQRIKAKIDQVELAQKLGVSEGYIGNIENIKNKSKANTRMLSRIALALDLDSYNKLFPKQVLKNDLVRIKLDLFNINTRKQVMDDKGGVPKRLKIVSVKPLTQDEISRWKKVKSPYVLNTKVIKNIFG